MPGVDPLDYLSLLMDSLKKLIDSASRSNQMNALLDQEMAKQLNIMKSPEHLDGSIYARMNQDVFNAYYDYCELKKRFLH